ncbi:MAG: sel1 repeat family protein, partial [Candidatus Accumulibacter sp.]|nr:sel1 repeat family protein [Accumulibacter sp.]
DARAQFNLGLTYAEGRGVAKDDSKVFEWFQKAAEQGLAEAQGSLGVMYWHGFGVARDPQKACRLWEAAGHQGNEKAMENYNENCSGHARRRQSRRRERGGSRQGAHS